MEAAIGCHMDVCGLLVDEAAIVDTSRQFQRTLMHWVAWWGHAKIARQILDLYGSHADCAYAPDGQDCPPVYASLAHQALADGFTEVLRELAIQAMQVRVVLDNATNNERK
ncbi:hypothetical protein CYMTET_34056 [Cymbomonas tetramitiformis]|uniref:Uncharacterized protein n=1 Tax=Cymbomonas tetramitiformis TaxID=36881 RepID=A0AAE0KQK9_9CHLO|nr:hypothetical protein CYMTET_34056 [Cymbomonas tetramitiformis]